MFRIGMFTSGYQRNPLENVFEDAKRFGYDYIELWGGRPHAYAPDLAAGEIDEVIRLRDKYGVPITGYCPEHNAYPYNFMIGSERQREDAVGYLKLCLDQAKALGSDYMLISPAHAGYEATYEEMHDRLYRTCEELAKHAENVGVHIVVEPLTPEESNVFRSANDLIELFEHASSRLKTGLDRKDSQRRRHAPLAWKPEHDSMCDEAREASVWLTAILWVSIRGPLRAKV